MNVCIVSSDMPTMRLAQAAMAEAAGNGEPPRYYLEWQPEGLDSLLPAEPPHLLVYHLQEGQHVDRQRLAACLQANPHLHAVFLLDRPSQPQLEDMLAFSFCRYLTAPFGRQAVAELLAKAIGDIQAQTHCRRLEERSRFWSAHEKLMQQQFWVRLLGGRISLEPIDIVKEGKACGVSIGLNDHFHLALLSRQLIKHRNQQVENETRLVLLRAADIWLEKRGVTYYLVDQLRPFLIVKNIPGDEFVGLIEDFIAFVGERQHMPLCCYYDVDVYYEDLFSAAKGILATAKEDVAEKPGAYRAFQIAQLPHSAEPVIPPHAEELLQNGQSIQFQQIIRSMLYEKFSQGEVNGKYLKMLKQDVLQQLYGYMQQKGVPAHCGMLPEAQKDIDDNAHVSIESFCAWMEALCQRLPADKQEPDTVEEIRRWVREHILENPTREEIAEQFYMNPDYLGKLFKRKTGESLGQYMNTERMKQARSLLLTTEKNVGEISAALGYDNFSYFSKSFQKFTGYTPREFRRRNLDARQNGQEESTLDEKEGS